MTIHCTGNPDGLAKVTDIRCLDHECRLLVLAWYYTRKEIQSEWGGNGKKHLDAQWLCNAPFTYMLSSNRTITMWDTLRGKALPDVMAKLWPDKFYVTTEFLRRICKAGHPYYEWMQKLLDLNPPLILDLDGKVTKKAEGQIRRSTVTPKSWQPSHLSGLGLWVSIELSIDG